MYIVTQLRIWLSNDLRLCMLYNIQNLHEDMLLFTGNAPTLTPLSKELLNIPAIFKCNKARRSLYTKCMKKKTQYKQTTRPAN